MDDSTNSIQQDFQLNVPVTWEATPCVLKEGWEGETQEPDQNEDKMYLVMDYYNDGSLFFHLRKSRKFSEKRARFYAAQLLMSMSHLHELNIAYRELKLENILMDDKGFIALTDFGISK
ncbi:hypothetical protein PsorP6_016931 [Peronosclerospora sorghi]|uniref:Uncharacterized protein n=1 Tax=Peronosclerospora sorghi TaxID=230839 RepID=A0ACC0WC28_9STRA|nr:hypothetical protein PsorP6_016931 [Peronosclerospora sorghi]